MCRYAFKVYKSHFACFKCRKAFKEHFSRSNFDKKRGFAVAAEDSKAVVLCPQCRNELCNIGLDFKAPKQNDVKQWKKVEMLVEHGFAFHSCGCCGPSLRPAELNQVEEFLAGS